MRKAYLLLLLAPSALIYACGGDDSGTDGGSDAVADNTTGDSGNKDTGGNDTGTDAGTDTGSTDSGGDVSLSVTCLQPADCIDGGVADASYPPAEAGVVCCGTVTGNGNQNNCSITGASTACQAPNACATSYAGLVSCGSATVRLCETAAECTEQAYNKCCVANTDGGAIKVCASNTIAQLSGGKIVCP